MPLRFNKTYFTVFDAIGKPTTGIRRGVLYFIGTYDQCQNIRAEIPINATLGEYRAETEVKFQGKYCRATFTPPRSLVESIAGDHINVCYHFVYSELRCFCSNQLMARKNDPGTYLLSRDFSYHKQHIVSVTRSSL